MSKRGTKEKSAERAAKKAARLAARDKMAVEVGKRLIVTRRALSRLGKAPKTQLGFAHAVGISKTSYNQYETGENMLTPDGAAKIYKRFGISLNWLYLGVVDELPAALHSEITKAG